MAENKWLLFLSQLPASPSSPRVAVWRRMRSAGAAGLQNGVWVLPRSAEHERFLTELVVYVKEQGGSGQILAATALSPAANQEILAQFRADRNQEYTEFREQCQQFIAEIEKETLNRKFTFAELEENEQDLEKLRTWLLKIQQRDFFGADLAGVAVVELESCRQALQRFAIQVYSQQGMEAGHGNPG